MVNAEEVKVGERLAWKENYSTGAADLVEKFDYAYVVPVLRNLENLLKNPEVRLNVENPKKGRNGTLKTVLDGSYYRENEFFRNNQNALTIILYYDDLGITNPLGANS